MADVSQTSPRDWKYVSEGGATIVFSYQGPAHPDFGGTVLRLRKTTVLAADAAQAGEEILQPQTEEVDDPTIEYQTKCMQRLIPPEHLPRLVSVRLDRVWLENLVALYDSLRPSERRKKDRIDLNKKKGVLATDLVGGDWIAVEIKPKWGFLPSAQHLSEETKSVKTQTCRYCMHSRLRGKDSTTDYCPLDLYSGDESRVRKAIESLWDGWVASNASLNNLKIFAKGKFLLPSEATLLVVEGDHLPLEIIREAFATALARRLLQTPVLRILSNLQRDLDSLDIEGLSKLWRWAQLISRHKTVDSNINDQDDLPQTPLGVSTPLFEYPQPGMTDWIDFLDTYLTNKPSLNQANPSPEHLHHYLLAYLLSATFKDCSIIVRLDFIRSGSSPQEEEAVKQGSVTVIDLDPKSMEKLKGWEELDREIAIAYASAEKKTCVDGWKT